jgi:hypothetical protein
MRRFRYIFYRFSTHVWSKPVFSGQKTGFCSMPAPCLNLHAVSMTPQNDALGSCNRSRMGIHEQVWTRRGFFVRRWGKSFGSTLVAIPVRVCQLAHPALT